MKKHAQLGSTCRMGAKAFVGSAVAAEVFVVCRGHFILLFFQEVGDSLHFRVEGTPVCSLILSA